jgi:hypothetical protein
MVMCVTVVMAVIVLVVIMALVAISGGGLTTSLSVLALQFRVCRWDREFIGCQHVVRRFAIGS